MITVIGAGSWGTALAAVLANNNHKVCIYGQNTTVLQDLSKNNCNSKYLNDIKLFNNLSSISVSNILENSISSNVQYIVVAIPSEYFSAVITEIKSIINSKKLINIPIIIASKGLSVSDSDSNSDSDKPLWLHQIVAKQLGQDYPVCVLSGPSFAKEVALKMPTSIVMAANNIKLATDASKIFHNNWFRVYTNTDLLGVELGGALKNILAFAVGCAEGCGFGSNARAAIITRGLHEMLALGKILGVKHDTLMGLSGLGDLVLTATDNQSRNKRFGNYIGQGLDINTAITKVGQHVASYSTTKLIYNLVKEYNLDLPLTEQSYKILFQNLSIEQAIANLSSRPQKSE